MIYGIDANSKSVAITCWNGSEYIGRKFDVWERWAVESAPWFRRILIRYFGAMSLYSGDSVFLEQPVVAGARNIMSTIKQAYISGIIQEVIGVYEATCVLVPVPTWKAAATGRGNASKDQVKVAVRLHCEHYANKINGDEDLFDSAGICIYGRTVVEGLEIQGVL